MSLKGFHIVFVTISTLLCIFLALWSFLFAPENFFALGVVGAAGALLMPAYGIYFYKKITRIHI